MTAESVPAALAPVVKQIEVRCTPERAFEIFTASIGAWWPLRTHSVFHADAASLSMEPWLGGEILETSTSGETSQWGTITRWEPGEHVAFTWYPGLPLDESTDVEVRFTPSAQGTLVELEHSGWERRRRPAARRSSYETGWSTVLDAFFARADPIA